MGVLPLPAKKINEAKAMELYNQGLIDTDIARCLGLSQTTVTNWRLRQGLKRNKLKKICIDCGKQFETICRGAKRCPECRRMKYIIYYEVVKLRCMMWDLIKSDPLTAYKIVSEMRKEEGEEFVRKYLGEKILNAINQKVNVLALAPGE